MEKLLKKDSYSAYRRSHFQCIFNDFGFLVEITAKSN